MRDRGKAVESGASRHGAVGREVQSLGFEVQSGGPSALPSLPRIRSTSGAWSWNKARARHPRDALDCGGKRSATPLSHGQIIASQTPTRARAKAGSPLRSATVLQNSPVFARGRFPDSALSCFLHPRRTLHFLPAANLPQLLHPRLRLLLLLQLLLFCLFRFRNLRFILYLRI